MKLIASFQVDHTRITPGVYVSRRDKVQGGWITTFDIRMKRPNVEPAVHPNAMHTIEHVVATYLRSSTRAGVAHRDFRRTFRIKVVVFP